MSKINHIDQIIFTYLAGDANLEEVQELRKWLNASPANKKQFEIIKNYWENSHLEVGILDGDQAFNKLKNKLYLITNFHNKSIEIQKKPTESSINWLKIMGIAASFILLVSSGIYFFYHIFQSSKPVNGIATEIKQNPAGQKSRIVLPDGSVVWLNSESSIRYPKHFSATQRDITLKGEAYFEVSKDVLRPFIVHSDLFDVTVLGTRFNVKSYSNDQNSSISLIDGKVRVHLTSQEESHLEPVYLTPGEELAYNTKHHQLVKHAFDKESVTAWKEGILIFKDATFSDLKEKLERWYGITIEVEGTPPNNFIVTGKFENEYLDNVLRTLQFGRDFNYVIEDSILIMKFNQNPKTL